MYKLWRCALWQYLWESFEDHCEQREISIQFVDKSKSFIKAVEIDDGDRARDVADKLNADFILSCSKLNVSEYMDVATPRPLLSGISCCI